MHAQDKMKKNIMTNVIRYDKKARMIDNFFEDLRRQLIATGIPQTQIARQAGIQQASLSRFLKGSQETVGGEALVRLVDWLGGEIRLKKTEEVPAEIDRNVCFVNARIVPAGEYAAPPVAEDYIAAPMVGEVGAGPGYLPEDEVKSWFLAYKNLPAIRHRRNLIAVEIGHNSTSMQPTLNPGDIVLVDRDDRDVTQPGHMMLVLDPDDGSGMIKRVSVTERKEDFQVTYYSDNGSKWPPMIYSLKHDFCDDWDKAIVGRVIWAWADVRGK